MNKRQRDLYEYYLEAVPYTELYEVYTSWSAEKGRAMRYCKEKFAETNGRNFKITSHNGWSFTVGWVYTNEDGNTVFHYATSHGHREWVVD